MTIVSGELNSGSRAYHPSTCCFVARFALLPLCRCLLGSENGVSVLTDRDLHDMWPIEEAETQVYIARRETCIVSLGDTVPPS